MYVTMCNVTFHCPQRPLEVSLNSKERLSLLKTAQKELHHDDDGALAQIPRLLDSFFFFLKTQNFSGRRSSIQIFRTYRLTNPLP